MSRPPASSSANNKIASKFMKIRLSRKLKQMASALLVVMVLGGILCLFVDVLPVADPAAEHPQRPVPGLEHRHRRHRSRHRGWAPGAQQRAALLSTADGWYFDGTASIGAPIRSALGGNWYTVTINLATPASRQITCPGLCDPAGAGGQHPVRLLRRRTASTHGVPASSAGPCGCAAHDSGLFLAAMVAKHKIDLKGNGVLTDSFDSADLWKSNFRPVRRDHVRRGHG